MKKIILIMISFSVLFAIQPQRIVHCPTAGIADNGKLLFFVSAFPGDGLRCGATLGLWDRLQAGVSYGAMNIVGNGSVKVDGYPGFEMRFRIKHEGISTPAVALGVETIGFGKYLSDRKRYEHKSRGAFIVTSKNWKVLWGSLGAHIGMNYSFEENFSRGFSTYIGIDKDFKDAVGFKLEYDLAIGDWKKPYGNGYGYLSAAICAYFGESSYVTFDFFDILGNIVGKVPPSREFFVYFGAKIF